VSGAPASSPSASPYTRLVERHGLGASHGLMLDQVPAGARVLDVGCATGYVAAELAGRGCWVVGVERDPAAAAAAEEHCDDVVVGDVESDADRARIPGEYDVILLGDVLEHLVDPLAALRGTRALLAPGGVVIASIPNVASWPARLSLARGVFEYADFGIFDRTHLRFFTRRTARALAAEAGFEVEEERFAPVERPPGRLRRALPLATDVAYKSLMRVWPELLAQQFVLRLRPAPGG
jgi:2-polyprenyl-3-methyl-5-hydroxy-6-metoxy-1,4-benzoquinol methylase